MSCPRVLGHVAEGNSLEGGESETRFFVPI